VQWNRETKLSVNTEQSRTLPDISLMNRQPEIRWCMRLQLVEFLVEVHIVFELLPETLFLAVNILDRYCSHRVVFKRHYQLFGCAALLIAAKYCEVKKQVPTLQELQAACASIYDNALFKKAEGHILHVLAWVIGHTTTNTFLHIAVAKAPHDAEVEHMALYINEIALCHGNYVSTRPSVLARSALALARLILFRSQAQKTDWAGAYDKTIMISLFRHLYHPPHMLLKKYASAHLSSVSATARRIIGTDNHAPPTHTQPRGPAVERLCTDHT
jgi:hypothetical protein